MQTILEKGGALLEHHFGEAIWTDLPIALGIFVTMMVLQLIVKNIILKRLHLLSKKTKSKLDDVLIEVCTQIDYIFFVAVSLFVSVQHMDMPEIFAIGIKAFFLTMLVYESVKILERVCMHFINGKFANKNTERQSSHALSVFVRIVLWCIGLLLIISNLGVNVGSLIAGLGIGGLAISLALQNVLSDLFSSFSIIIDKPFEEGDYIDLGGGYDGTVKKIGLKTTRIETLQGQELVVSNAELTSTKIQNYKRMEQRRQVLQLGVTYSTPLDTMKKIPSILEDIISKQPDTQFDRAHFYEFGDFSLKFELVYFLHKSTKIFQMKTLHNVNLAIGEVFEKEGIEFAYPTQTVFVEKG